MNLLQGSLPAGGMGTITLNLVMDGNKTSSSLGDPVQVILAFRFLLCLLPSRRESGCVFLGRP